MIYVEQHLLNPKTMMPVASSMKRFISLPEFQAFYKIAKSDPCSILNVLNYDPQEKPGQKTNFDAKLFSVSRVSPENAI
jgi:hypothetical protein